VGESIHPSPSYATYLIALNLSSASLKLWKPLESLYGAMAKGVGYDPNDVKVTAEAGTGRGGGMHIFVNPDTRFRPLLRLVV